ncbi:hypothetical protein YC2023_018059 [Brassica napus]
MSEVALLSANDVCASSKACGSLAAEGDKSTCNSEEPKKAKRSKHGEGPMIQFHLIYTCGRHRIHSQNVGSPISKENHTTLYCCLRIVNSTSLNEANPQLLNYFDKLGVPLYNRNVLANVAVDAVLDSVSLARKTLESILI